MHMLKSNMWYVWYGIFFICTRELGHWFKCEYKQKYHPSILALFILLISFRVTGGLETIPAGQCSICTLLPWIYAVVNCVEYLALSFWNKRNDVIRMSMMPLDEVVSAMILTTLIQNLRISNNCKLWMFFHELLDLLDCHRPAPLLIVEKLSISWRLL